MTKKDNYLRVNALENGTVIDHIPADKLFDVITILKLDQICSMITFGKNLDSKKFGKKAIIKIDQHFFKKSDIDRIALVAPEARLNIIKHYRVSEKWNVEIPDLVIGIIKCANPNCITNHEKITTRFDLVSKNPLAVRCVYCEKITAEEQVEII